MIQVITLQFQSFFSFKFFNEFYDLEVIINDASKVFKPLLFFKKHYQKNLFIYQMFKLSELGDWTGQGKVTHKKLVPAHR